MIMIFFNKFYGYQKVVPTDNMGLPYTKDEVKRIVTTLMCYLNECPDSVIEAERQAFFERYFPRDYGLEPQPILNRKTRKSGFIYLLSRNGGAHKIGYSQYLDNRVKELQRNNPSIKLEHFFEADDIVEAEWELHQSYADKALGGEWFSLSHTDIYNIKTITEYAEGQFLRRRV